MKDEGMRSQMMIILGMKPNVRAKLQKMIIQTFCLRVITKKSASRMAKVGNPFICILIGQMYIRVSQKNTFVVYNFGGRITGAYGCPEPPKKISEL